MERLRQDLSFGFKSLLRQPGFTLIAVVTLALGIGANAAMVSFALPLLYPQFPYEDSDRLVFFERQRAKDAATATPKVSYPAFLDWQERNQSCLHLALLNDLEHNLTDSGNTPERVDTLMVSGNILETLGIKPMTGRGFSPEDDVRGAPRTAMLTYEFWQRRFRGDPEILEQQIRLEGLVYDVIGILPPGLDNEKLNEKPMGPIWLPINLLYDEQNLSSRLSALDFSAICRLNSGVSISAAQEEMTKITEALAVDFPDSDDEKVTRVRTLHDVEVGEYRTVVLSFLAAVVFLLAITCVNLINFFLSRFSSRQKEFALRSALGARRSGLISLGLSEALILAVAGAFAGLSIASLMVRSLPAFLQQIPYADRAKISPAVLVYTFLLSIGVTLVIGLIPALRTISPIGQTLLGNALGSRSVPDHGRFRRALIVCEFALALALVTATGLVLVSAVHLSGEELGFSTRGVLSLDVTLPSSQFTDVLKWTTFYDQSLANVSTLPGVTSVAVTTTPPLSRGSRAAIFAGDREPPPKVERMVGHHFTVSPRFLQVLNIPLIEGRTFTIRDKEGWPMAIIISRSVAEKFWPSRSAVGEKIGFEYLNENPLNPEIKYREVVGVVENIRYLTPISQPTLYAVFVPYTQRPNFFKGHCPPMTMLVKTEVEPKSLVKPIHSKLLELHSEQPIHGVRTIDEALADELQNSQKVLVLLGLIATVALVMALVGIYGVVSYVVETGKQAIGIRMALGATPSQVMARLLWQNLVLFLIAAALGWTVTAAAAAVVANQSPDLLYGIGPFDWSVYSVASLALLTVALLATLIPVLRATRFRPSHLLRHE